MINGMPSSMGAERKARFMSARSLLGVEKMMMFPRRYPINNLHARGDSIIIASEKVARFFARPFGSHFFSTVMNNF